MTVAALTPSITFVGSSGAGNLGPFSLTKNGGPITFQSNDYIKVYRYDGETDSAPVLLVEGTDYSLTGGPSAGAIMLTAPQTGLLTDERLFVHREQPVEQNLDLTSGGEFSSEAIEARLDRMTEMIAENRREVRLTMRFRNLGGDSIDTAPSFHQAIDKITYFTGTADNPSVAFISNPENLAGNASILVPFAGAIEDVAADLTGADTIGIVAADLAGDNNIGATGSNIGNVNQVAAAIADGTLGEVAGGLAAKANADDAVLTGDTSAETLGVSGTATAPYFKSNQWVDLGFYLPDPASPDWTAAWNAAAADGATDIVLPSITMNITDRLSCPVKTTWRGAHKGTILNIDAATFNMAATGVIGLEGVDSGAALRDFQMEFIQPDTAVRAELNAYPKAINADGVANFSIRDVRVYRGLVHLSMIGNCGGAEITNFQTAALEKDFDIDGALHTVMLVNPQAWVYGLTANQRLIREDGNAIGLNCGRCDDLQVIGGDFFSQPVSAKFYSSASGTAFATLLGTNFDDRGGVLIQAGRIRMTSNHFSLGKSDARLLRVQGGILHLSNPDILITGSTPVDNQLLFEGGETYWNGGKIRATGAQPNRIVYGLSTAHLEMNDVTIEPNTGYTHANPIIRIEGSATGHLRSVRALNSPSGGSGQFISTNRSPADFEITDCMANGWTLASTHGMRPDGWTQTPGTAGGSGTTFNLIDRFWSKRGQKIELNTRIEIAAAGSGTGAVTFTLPASSLYNATLEGHMTRAADPVKTIAIRIAAGSDVAFITLADGTSPITTANRFHISGEYYTDS